MPNQDFEKPFVLARAVLAIAAAWIFVFPIEAQTIRKVSHSSSTEKRDILPNIILINLDDADRDAVEIDFLRNDSYDFLPNIDRLAREGLRFTNMHSTTQLCCPSRVCLFTGQYAHKHGVKNNDPTTSFARGTTGGYTQFAVHGAFDDRQLPSLSNEIGVWMKRAGYHTMFVGKYLHNGYELQVGQTWKDLQPPGWDEFFASLGASYYTTVMVHNGIPFQLNLADSTRYPNRYRTAAETVEAVEMIRQHVQSRSDSFFMYLAPLAPHREQYSELCFEEDKPNKGMVEPRYRNWWSELKQVPGPDFNELDMSDKPAVLRNLPPLRDGSAVLAENDVLLSDVDFRRRVLSLRSVDDMVQEVLKTLEELDIVDQTIVILTSDHGYHLGQNRVFGKKTPFHRCTNVPFLVWGPGYFSPDPVPRTHLLANIDVAPTMLQLAGQPIPPTVQGKSFYPVLINSFTQSPRDWRPEGILIENWEGSESAMREFNSSYVGLRLHDTVYSEWSSGDREFYDLAKDPYQLDNQIANLSAEQQVVFQQQISNLRAEFPEPISYIENPKMDGDVNFRKVEIAGFSEFKSPLKHVKLTITDVTTSGEEKFWTGSTWSNEYAFVLATMSHRGGVISDWTYEFMPHASSERKYRVTARATAIDGSFQTKPTQRSFILDAEQPYCQITSPKSEEVIRFYKPIGLTGWARDNDGIRSVRVTIRNSKTRLFWNGQTWQVEPISLVPRMVRINESQQVNWNYDFNPPESSGMCHLNIRPYDIHGNTDPQPRSLRFSWKK